MTKDDYQDFADLWAGALEQYGKKATDNGTVMAFRVLAQYEWSKVSAAIIAYLGDEVLGKWLIKPSEVVGIINRGPESAWHEFIDAIGRVGPYADPRFSDPRINAGVRAIGGWVQCGKMTHEELEARRNDFSAGYADADEHTARPVLGLESKQREEAGELDLALINLANIKRLK